MCIFSVSHLHGGARRGVVPRPLPQRPGQQLRRRAEQRGHLQGAPRAASQHQAVDPPHIALEVSRCSTACQIASRR